MNRDRFDELADRLPERRIVVMGDIMLDRYLAGPADRVSPEAPVPVVRVAEEWDAVGGAANVAANVLALGARCDLIGVVGDDRAASAVERSLAGLGCGCRFVADAARATTVKTRVLARGQQVARIDREDDRPAPPEVEAALAELVRRRLPGAGALAIADYDKGGVTAPLARAAVAAAAGNGVPVVADPKRRNFHAYAGACVVKPNRSELEAVVGETARPDDPAWMEAARALSGAEHLLLTLGGDGMALASPGGVLERVHARARAVYDVSGAGDTVAAVVAALAAAGASLPEAVRAAAAAAAAVVAKVGVATVGRGEIAAMLPEA